MNSRQAAGFCLLLIALNMVWPEVMVLAGWKHTVFLVLFMLLAIISIALALEEDS